MRNRGGCLDGRLWFCLELACRDPYRMFHLHLTCSHFSLPNNPLKTLVPPQHPVRARGAEQNRVNASMVDCALLTARLSPSPI